MKKIAQIAALLLIAAASTNSYACYNCPDCDLSGCVSWDFTDTPDGGTVRGDPLYIAPNVSLPPPGQGPDKLVVHGFGIGVYGDTGSGTGAFYDDGVIYQSAPVAVDDGGGTNLGLGVDSSGAPGEPGAFVDARYSNQEKKWLDNIANVNGAGDKGTIRDGLVLQTIADDGEACLVSVEHIGIDSHDLGYHDRHNPPAEFELWAYLGANLDDVANYNEWDQGINTDVYKKIELDGEYCCGDGTEFVYTPTGENANVESEFFFVVMNHPSHNKDAKIRLTGLSVTCDDCGGNGEVPVPGTLALLGIGAIATRRYWLKAR